MLVAIRAIRDLLHRHPGTLHPLLDAPAPRWQQAPKGWKPGPIRPCQSEAVIGGQEAKTIWEWVVYQPGRAILLTTVMEDVMATLGWAMVLPRCEQPKNHLPSDTRLHRLLVSPARHPCVGGASPAYMPRGARASGHVAVALGWWHIGPHHGLAPNAAGGPVLGVGVPGGTQGVDRHTHQVAGAVDRAQGGSGGTLQVPNLVSDT